jgi:hypothetical protein
MQFGYMPRLLAKLPVLCSDQAVSRKIPSMKSKLRYILAVMICLLSLQACGDTTLHRNIQSLAEMAKGSSAKVEKFYDGLQSAHSKMRTDELKLQAEAATSLDPAVPGPICPFTADDAATRIRAAKFVEIYSVKLNDIICSKNPNEMQSAISDVSSQLAGFNIKNFDPVAAFQAASSPITTGLKIVSRRDQWLKQALSKSDDVYVEQTKQLKLELNADADEAVTRATALQGRAERIYKKRVANHAAQEEQKSALDDVNRISSFRQGLVKDNPSETYSELLDIHNQIMTSVQTDAKK